MRPSGVVAVPPLLADGTYFGADGENPRIEYLLLEAAVETIDVGALIGFSGCDLGERDATRLRPSTKGLGDELRPVIAEKLTRLSMLRNEVIQHGD